MRGYQAGVMINTPTFTWVGTDSHSGVEGYYWKVDGGTETWTTFTSVTLPRKKTGTHAFYVRAKDNAGNLGNWISHTFQIDTKPPNLSNKQQNKITDDQLNNYSSLPSNTYYYYKVVPEYSVVMLLMLVERKTKKTSRFHFH
jgi:hypothetical protein